MPVALSELQFLHIVNAAAALNPLDRDSFLVAVATALQSQRRAGAALGPVSAAI
jgi:hypothetical protein